MSPGTLKILKFLLVIGLLAGFLVFVPIQQIYAAVRSADPGRFWISVLLGIFIIYLGTISMWLLARKQGIQISIYNLFVFNLVIRFYGFFSPASVLATGLRWHRLSKGGKTTEALSVIAFQRALDVFVAVCFGLFWAMTSISRDAVNPLYFALFLVLMLISWIGLTRVSAHVAAWLRKKSSSLRVNFFQRPADFLARLLDSITLYTNFSVPEFFRLLGLHVLVEIIGLVSYVLLAVALNIPVPLSDLGWMRAIFFLAALAPFTLAGGFGVSEISVVVVMSAFGIHPDLSAAYSFLLYARGAILSLLGGVIELLSMFTVRGKT